MNTDFIDCGQEPIHHPNLIQPHGALLVLGRPRGEVVQLSANVGEVLGIDPKAALGLGLNDVLGEEAARRLHDFIQHRLSGEKLMEGPPVRVARKDQVFETALHTNGSEWVIEFTPRTSAEPISLAFVNQAIGQIKRSLSVADFCHQAVETVRTLTGFDRVMVYRFLDDATGVVVAEAVRDGMGSYLGHHFPAADIPPQARDLYTRNWIRIICDVHAAPIPVSPARLPRTEQPLDMTHCLLRNVSPVHIEYLKNMGVRASASLSIMVGDRLWGLIACHHETPKNLPEEVRTACELLAQLLSIEMGSKERLDTRLQRIRLKAIQQALREIITDSGPFDEKRLAGAVDLLQLMDASGFAMHLEDRWMTVGAVPPPERLASLMRWVNRSPEDVVAVDQWPADRERPQDPSAAFAGVLAIRLSRQANGAAFWFRPEWVHIIPWAGNPKKEPAVIGERLNPRKSFALWSEEVRGRSRSWKLFESVWAGEIRRTLIEMILRRNERRMAQLNEGLEKEIVLRTDELRRKDEALHRASKLEAIGRVTGGIAHDFNNLLVGISGMISDVRESLTPGDARQEDIDAVLQAITRAFALTKQLLAFGRRQPSSATNLSVNEVIREMSNLLQSVIPARISLVTELGDVPAIRLDKTHLEQILMNLVVNARDAIGGQGTITLRTRGSGLAPDARQAIVEVEDTGAGMAPDVQAHIFEPFFSTKTSEHGTGLGLATVYGIVKQAGGDIEVDSRVGRGTRFQLHFPAAQPEGRPAPAVSLP